MLSSCIYSLFKNDSTCSYEFASEYRYAHIPLALLSYAVIALFLFSFLSRFSKDLLIIKLVVGIKFILQSRNSRIAC